VEGKTVPSPPLQPATLTWGTDNEPGRPRLSVPLFPMDLREVILKLVQRWDGDVEICLLNNVFVSLFGFG
jgi:hypothetical protein